MNPDIALAEAITDAEPELVFAVVSPTGADQDRFENHFADYVKRFGYELNVVRISGLVHRLHTSHLGLPPLDESTPYRRTDSLMTTGNQLRRTSGRGDVMALFAIADIVTKRRRKEPKNGGPREQDADAQPLSRTVHLLRSLKHPDEVETLRRVYGTGFFLIGLHSPEEDRHAFLQDRKNMSRDDAQTLIDRDSSERDPFGQQTRNTFELSDVYVQAGQEAKELARFLDLVFGNPHMTPSRDEHFMFLAYGASLRSGQLGRQVGAAIKSVAGDHIASGANDVPKFDGGLYWSDDPRDMRDHQLGRDPNDTEIQRIIDEVLALVQKHFRARDLTEEECSELVRRCGISLKNSYLPAVTKALNTRGDMDLDALRSALAASRVDDLTEYGRAVHAEMEALLACARVGVSPRGGTLYTTTFPCHNCAKHIVGSGIHEVVYVEPYPKSKAFDLHDDSIVLQGSNGISRPEHRVIFRPFIGVAARRYIDLFSMRLSAGVRMRRKNSDGSSIIWKRAAARPRLRMSPFSYLLRESIAGEILEAVLTRLGERHTAPKPPEVVAPSSVSGDDGRNVIEGT